MSLTLIHPIEKIETLFLKNGHLNYGEDVTHLHHSLQSALLAEEAQASEELIVAALLHDIGHLLHRDAEEASLTGMDDLHEKIGAKYLARWFWEDVTTPIGLHVQAKRYLCVKNPDYYATLSEASKRSLEIQGGPLRTSECADFEKLRYAADAISLRLWDDLAKDKHCTTPDLSYYLPFIERCMKPV